MVCAGSAHAEARYPDEDTIESREGTAVHEAGASVLYGAPVAVGEVMSNNVVLNVEMMDAAEIYAEYIKSIAPHVVPENIEATVRSAALHDENWGTPDYWFYDQPQMTLHVWDLKYGHRWVNPRMNWQLMNYAALLLRQIGLYGDDRIRVVLHIVQPRANHRSGPLRSWSTTLSELRKPLAALSARFREAMDPNAPVTASDPAQCLDCKARHDCEAALSAAYYGVDISTQSTPLHMSPAAMAAELRKLERAELAIKARREGVAQDIERTIRRQRSVPGFALEPKEGRTVWIEEAQQHGIIALARAYNVDVVKGVDLITPKQTIKAGVPEHIVKMYSRKNSGSLVLVEDDGSEAARIFTNGRTE